MPPRGYAPPGPHSHELPGGGDPANFRVIGLQNLFPVVLLDHMGLTVKAAAASLVLCGVFTVDQVPNLFNLRVVVREIVNDLI